MYNYTLIFWNFQAICIVFFKIVKKKTPQGMLSNSFPDEKDFSIHYKY